MKKALIATLLALSTSACASGPHPGHGVRHGHYGHGHGHWIAPLIIGGAVGAIIANEVRRPDPAPVVVQPPFYGPPLQTYYDCLITVWDPVTRTYRNHVATCVR